MFKSYCADALPTELSGVVPSRKRAMVWYRFCRDFHPIPAFSGTYMINYSMNLSSFVTIAVYWLSVSISQRTNVAVIIARIKTS